MQLHIPQGPNLDGSNGRKTAAAEAAKGLAALPHMAEIWPLGGLLPFPLLGIVQALLDII